MGVNCLETLVIIQTLARLRGIFAWNPWSSLSHCLFQCGFVSAIDNLVVGYILHWNLLAELLSCGGSGCCNPSCSPLPLPLPQEALQSLLLPHLTDYLSAFVQLLSSHSESNSDPGLRKEIVMTLCSLLRELPKAINQHIMQIVTPIWNILVASTPM